MSGSLMIGPSPVPMTLVLFRDASWAATFAMVDRETGAPLDFEDGVRIEIRIGTDAEDVWVAVIDGNLASWNIPANRVKDAWGSAKATIWYIQGATEIPWAAGKVRLNG